MNAAPDLTAVSDRLTDLSAGLVRDLALANGKLSAKEWAAAELASAADRIVADRMDMRATDIKRQADHYVRVRDLPRALPTVTDDELLDCSATGAGRIVAKLKRRLASYRPGYWAHAHIDAFAIRAAIMAEERRASETAN